MKDPAKKSKSSEEVKAENALLKLKLEVEFGMKENATAVPPEIENMWLNSIYKLEQSAQAETVSVYDKLGRPPFRKCEELQPEEVTRELARLYNLMRKSQILLDCNSEYDDFTIYKFVTEELFHHQVINFDSPEMTLHFVYEEFHPNDDKSQEL